MLSMSTHRGCIVALRLASFAVCLVAAAGGVVAGLVSPQVGARPADAKYREPNLAAPHGHSILAGPARIIDGDTIDVAGVRIRLEGIDAPETAQTCERATGGTWNCGIEATRVLAALTSDEIVECAGRGQDVYGRMLATCFVRGIDLNAELVRRGLAWAFVKYSSVYVREEASAKAAHIGIWQAATTPAWSYRATRWTTASDTAPEGCAIKGNVSTGGRIYHMPWSPWYTKVSMRADKGTRWFCSEAEAIGAGWRAAHTR